jgi:hypothetical protein
MLFVLWFSTTVGEGRLWERLRIYSGKYLFNKSKFYLKIFLSLLLHKALFYCFLLARSNTRDIPFSNVLISKKQFLCNKKSYCTLVQNQWMKLRGTRVQYGFLLHRNCFSLINVRKFKIIKLKQQKIKVQNCKKKKNLNFKNFLKFQFFFKNFIKFQN